MAKKPLLGPMGMLQQYGAQEPATAQLPVLKNYMVNQPNITNLRCWWKYTATKTGYILVDTKLSTNPASDEGTGPGFVAFDMVGAVENARIEFDEFGELSVGADAKLFYVVKDQVYRMWADPYFQLTSVRIRISDFATERIVDTPDQRAAYSPGHAGQWALDPSSLNHQVGEFPDQYAPWIDLGYGNTGHFTIDKALGGVPPGEIPAAINCCWNHARQMSGSAFDSFYWGANPADYPRWNPGMQVCEPVYPIGWDQYGARGGGPQNLGFGYNAAGNGGALQYSQCDWWVYHVQARINLDNARATMRLLGQKWVEKTYGSPYKFGSGANGTGYRYEFLTGKIPGHVVKLELALDEFGDGFQDASYAQVTGKPFLAINTTGEHAHQHPMPSGSTNRYWPGGLESAYQATSVASMPAWSGGYYPWYTVPESVLAAAHAYEKATGGDVDNNYSVAAPGLGFAMVPDGTLDPGDPIPGALASYNVRGLDRIRSGQILQSRWTAEYPQHKVLDYPPYPDSTMLGIAGGPTDSERHFVGRR